MIPNDAGFTAGRSFTLGGRTYDILFGGTGDGVTVRGDDLRAIVTSIRPTSG